MKFQIRRFRPPRCKDNGVPQLRKQDYRKRPPLPGAHRGALYVFAAVVILCTTAAILTSQKFFPLRKSAPHFAIRALAARRAGPSIST